ncbi:chorismate mutase [Vibrio sp. Of7-15]|uniref:chorismate mutase n=1 Tax=Vibrio sp. Of7-15 TaxID=2724879 RepID=UPI001EF2D397|nr:chorismate mutase [Vibrio sp. Of7-15]
MFQKLPLLLLAFLSFQAFSATEQTDLFSTINARLSYMEDVALYKVNHQKPIEDIKREQFVIEKATYSAEALGLDKKSIAAFYTAQISAAKAIQYRYRADLLNQPTNKKPRDLKAVIRPELIALGKKIDQEILSYLQTQGQFSEGDWEAFSATINRPYLTTVDKRALFNALLAVRLK